MKAGAARARVSQVQIDSGRQAGSRRNATANKRMAGNKVNPSATKERSWMRPVIVATRVVRVGSVGEARAG